MSQATKLIHELPTATHGSAGNGLALSRLAVRAQLQNRLNHGLLLGNLLTSLTAGVGTLLWVLIFHVPYPLLLAFAVAILDLIRIVGSTVGGIIVSLVALTVCLPVAIATAAFYILYRLAEDYLLVPKIIGRTVRVPAITTLIAVLIGGGVLGIIGALVAIPLAAALDVLLREFAYPRLDRS